MFKEIRVALSAMRNSPASFPNRPDTPSLTATQLLLFGLKKCHTCSKSHCGKRMFMGYRYISVLSVLKPLVILRCQLQINFSKHILIIINTPASSQRPPCIYLTTLHQCESQLCAPGSSCDLSPVLAW